MVEMLLNEIYVKEEKTIIVIYLKWNLLKGDNKLEILSECY